jgi:carbonic anhydrase
MEFVNKVSLLNVQHAVNQMQEQSEVIRSYVEKGAIKIVPAMYDIATGKVAFHHQMEMA